MKIMMFVCALFATQNAFAETWYFMLSTLSDRHMAFFDADSVVKRNHHTLVWVRTAQYDPFSKPEAEVHMRRLDFDCAEFTIKMRSDYAYDIDGVSMYSSTQPSDATEPPPGTIGHRTLDLVCSDKFPLNPSSDTYYRVRGNHITEPIKLFFRAQHDAKKAKK